MPHSPAEALDSALPRPCTAKTMATTTIEAQIKERLQAFAQELDLLVRRGTLDSLRSVLEGGGASARRGRPRGRGRAPAASADGFASRIAGHVKANPGQTVGQIVLAIRASSGAVKKTIKSMLAVKAIRKAGEKRGTRYFPAGAGRLPGSSRKRRAKRRKPKARRRATRTARRAKRATKPKRKARATVRRGSPKKAVVIAARSAAPQPSSRWT